MAIKTKSARNFLFKISRIAYLTALKNSIKKWGVTSHKKLALFQWHDVETSEDCTTDPLNFESVETWYFKTVLGLSKYSVSGFVYALLDFDPL
jgi:hypothetical protein